MDNKLTIAQPKEITQSPDIMALITKWHESLDLRVHAGELDPDTAKTYRIGCGKFIDWIGQVNATLIDPDTIRAWIAYMLDKGYKKRSINTWLSGVRAFFRWCVDSRLTPYDPTATVKGKSRRGETKMHVRKVLTNSEIRALLAQPDRSTKQGIRDYAMLSLFAYTAMRTVEVNRADLSDLQTIGNQPVLYYQGKGHDTKDDYKKITDKVADALQDWLRIRGNQPGALFTSMSDRSAGQRLTLRSIREIVKSCMIQAGIDDPQKTTHSLRHTAITNAAVHNATPQQLQDLAGHASMATTGIYIHQVNRLANPAEDLIDYSNMLK